VNESGAALQQPYRPGYGCSGKDPLQRALNQLYDYANDQETKVLHRSRLNLFHRLMSGSLGRRFTRRGRALDLGCNAGYYSKMISDFGFEDVLGIDIEPPFVERAQRTFGSDAPGRTRRFVVGNAEELGETDAFDFILCTEVIEHTQHPDRVIANVARALRPGAIALVTLPNRVSLPYEWAVWTHRLKGIPYDPVLRDHLSWPFMRARRLLEPFGCVRVGTAGTNVILLGPLIEAAYGKPGFAALHRLDGQLSRLGPLKFVSQFFFTVWSKPARS
jgi:SAM-dependent methyltransferase